MIVNYRMDTRIMQAKKWFEMLERRAKRQGNPIPKSTSADILFQAGNEALIRALWHGVDWVVIISSMYFMKQSILLLKRAGLKVAIYFTESPYDDEQQSRLAEHADVCWTNERSSLGRLRVWNPNSYYLPHGYNPEKHYPKEDNDDTVPAHDVVFVGTGFEERVELLSAVDWDGIDFGLYGCWPTLASRHRLRKYIRGKETDNKLTAELYRKAKIGLNLYRVSKGFGKHATRIKHAESMSPRAYELAACGAFHLSEYRQEVGEIFNNGRGDLVPTFSTPDELSRLIREWLPKERERKQIASVLPIAVGPHTWGARAEQMTEDLMRAEASAN
jgi:spore maturation protein CgeB